VVLRRSSGSFSPPRRSSSCPPASSLRPQSVCLDHLLSFPDWVQLKSAPCLLRLSSAIRGTVLPPPVWFPDLWCIWAVHVVGAGPSLNTRLLMGPCNSDDIALLSLRPLVLPLLLAFTSSPMPTPGGLLLFLPWFPSCFSPCLQRMKIMKTISNLIMFSYVIFANFFWPCCSYFSIFNSFSIFINFRAVSCIVELFSIIFNVNPFSKLIYIVRNF